MYFEVAKIRRLLSDAMSNSFTAMHSAMEPWQPPLPLLMVRTQLSRWSPLPSTAEKAIARAVVNTNMASKVDEK